MKQNFIHHLTKKLVQSKAQGSVVSTSLLLARRGYTWFNNTKPI